MTYLVNDDMKDRPILKNGKGVDDLGSYMTGLVVQTKLMLIH